MDILEMEDGIRILRKVNRSEINLLYAVYPYIHYKYYSDGVEQSVTATAYLEKGGYLVTVTHTDVTRPDLQPYIDVKAKLRLLVAYSITKVDKFYRVGMDVYDTKGVSIDIKILEDEV